MRRFIQKSLIKNYQNLVDQVPRNVKPFLHRLIIWEEGKGQASYQLQKHNINEKLSQIAKQLIQSKISTFTSQIRQHQSQPSTPKSLLHIFLLKNKLACLYSHLSLNTFAHDLLADLWNQMMINFRCLMKLSSAGKFGSYQKLETPEDIPRSPYTFENTNDILGYFESTHSTAYLRIVTHAFLKFFTFSLEMDLYFQALSKLKNCLDFILNNVLVLARRNDWTKQQMILFDISRNLWAIEVIKKCLKQFDNAVKDSQANLPGDASKIHVSICSMLRNSVERIGLILYQFDNYSIFPGNVQKQLQFIHEKVLKLKQPWKNHKQSIQSLGSQAKQQLVEKSASLMKRQQFVGEIPENGPNELKLRQLISQKVAPCQDIVKLLVNFQSYSQVYLQVLQIMFVSLKNSPFRRVAKSLKLTVERATIMLGDWYDYERVKDQPEQFKYQWPQLHAIEELYRLFFLFVKLLAGELEQKQDISKQLVKVLINKELQNDKSTVISIASLVNDIFQLYGISITMAKITSLQIGSDKSVTAIVKSDLSNFLRQGTDWNLATTQIMLNEGDQTFKLDNLQIRQFKKCDLCQTQCRSTCTELPLTYTQIKGKLQFSNGNQQTLFYAKELFFILTSASSKTNLVLKLKIPRHLQNVLHKINTPKLVFDSGREYVEIFSQTWTPVRIKLQKINHPTELSKINVSVESIIVAERNKSEDRGVKWLEPEQEAPVEAPQKHMAFQISELICIVRGGKQEYCKVSQNLDIPIQKSSQMCIVAFVRGRKPQKIQRNSRRRKEQVITQQCVTIQITLRSNQGNKTYQIKERSQNIVLRSLILLEYHVVQSYEQFTITNLRDLIVQISEQKQAKQQKNSSFLLQKDESLCIESRLISISPSQYTQMKAQVNLNDWFDEQLLLQQKSNTFKLSYRTENSYNLFKPILIESELQGIINIPYLDDSYVHGFEMVGKIRGEVHYQQGKYLGIRLIPIRTGNIVLPQVWINGKRGIWTNSLITNIQP